LKEITLALSGGAAKGAYHLGVLQYLDEQKVHIKAISATSIGAIIGASYACGISPKEQLEIFKSKEFKNIFSLNLFSGSLLKVDTKAEILKKLIPLDNLEDLSIPLYLSAVDMHSGEYLSFSIGDVKQICLAASALVPMFSPVAYSDKTLIDGGIINNMPIKPLEKYPYKIVGVNLKPVSYEDTKNNFFSILKRVMFLRTYGNAQMSKNKCDVYITSFALEKYSMFSFKHLDAMFKLGYEEVKKIIQ